MERRFREQPRLSDKAQHEEQAPQPRWLGVRGTAYESDGLRNGCYQTSGCASRRPSAPRRALSELCTHHRTRAGGHGKPSHAQLRPPGSPHRQGLLCKGPPLARCCSLKGGGSGTTRSSTTGSSTRAQLGSIAGALQHSVTSAGCSSRGCIIPRVLQIKGGECQGQAILGRFPPYHGRYDLKIERDGTGCSTDAILLPV